MARNEGDFRIRPGKVRDRGGGRIGAVSGRPTSFVGEVQRAIRRAGGNPSRIPGTRKGGGRFNARGRGAATALSLKDRSAWSRDGSGARTRARRVAVKARVVKLNPQRGAARGRQFVSAKAVVHTCVTSNVTASQRMVRRVRSIRPSVTRRTAVLFSIGGVTTAISSASSSRPRTAPSCLTRARPPAT